MESSSVRLFDASRITKELLSVAFKAFQILAPDSGLALIPQHTTIMDSMQFLLCAIFSCFHELRSAPCYGISIPGPKDEETQLIPGLRELTT